jgi:hypothetical protein
MAFDADADDSFHLMIEAFADSLESRSAAVTLTAAQGAARVPTSMPMVNGGQDHDSW